MHSDIKWKVKGQTTKGKKVKVKVKLKEALPWSLFQGKEYEWNSGMLTLRGEMWEWDT